MIQVHGDVIQLLLQTRLCLVHLFEADGFLLQPLAHLLQVLLQLLLRLLQAIYCSNVVLQLLLALRQLQTKHFFFFLQKNVIKINNEMHVM